MSDELNKSKLQLYKVMKERNPNFKFCQLSKIKFGYDIVNFMTKHNIPRESLVIPKFRNIPDKIMNRRSIQNLNFNTGFGNGLNQTADEYVKWSERLCS